MSYVSGISGAWNKAADCLFRLVKQPTDSKATIKTLTATNSDGPAFNTRSKTSHHCQTTMDAELSNTQSIRGNLYTRLTTVETAQDITLKPLTADRHEASLKMQKMDPFLNASPNGYWMERHQSMRPIYSHTLRDYYTNMSWTQTKHLWHLSNPKLGSIQPLPVYYHHMYFQ